MSWYCSKCKRWRNYNQLNSIPAKIKKKGRPKTGRVNRSVLSEVRILLDILSGCQKKAEFILSFLQCLGNRKKDEVGENKALITMLINAYNLSNPTKELIKKNLGI